jgi:Dolichyl-phosphate-mannose-protein mannosyltransferase
MSSLNFPDTIERPLEYQPSGEIALSDTALLLGLAAAKIFLQLLGISRYGLFRDELYYMACGQHLAWGYIDQPPIVALIAWLACHLFGDSLFAIRLLPVLAGAATVVLTALLSRELGGGRLAQFVAAIGVLFAPLFLAMDGFLSMNAFEPVFWLSGAWIVVRIVKGASPKLWLAFGVVAGLGLENKHTMLVFGLALTIGLLLSNGCVLFRSKWIWAGALLAFALFLPNLIWEARHGWPQIEVVQNAQNFKNVRMSAAGFLFDQLLFVQLFSLPLWLGGLAWYFFAPEGKRFRFLGWTYLIVLAIFMLLDGKSYYLLPAYPLLMAAGGLAFERFSDSQRRPLLTAAYPAVLILGGLITLPFGVPVLPVDTFVTYSNAIPYARFVKTERDATADLPQLYADMFGWEGMAETIAGVYHSLPQSEQASCAILAGNYGEAGAIDYYGPKLGLPPAISGHNSYYLWGPRRYSGGCVILFGERSNEYKNYFGSVERVATISNPHAMPSEQNVPVYLCRKPRAPLASLWPHFSLII